MSEAFKFWIAKTLAEIAIWLVVVGCIAAFYGLVVWSDYRKQKKRKGSK